MPEPGTRRPGGSLRLAVGLLTRIPVGDVSGAAGDRTAVGRAMLSAPLVGLGLAAAAVVPIKLGRLLLGDVPVAAELPAHSALLLAALAVALVQWLVRGLHIDGVADTADALAVNGTPQARREVMKRSDIGPNGVLTLALLLVVQVGALAVALGAGHGAFALASGLVIGRLCLVWAARLPAATGTGLGGWVSGTVALLPALLATGGYWLVLGAVLLLDADPVGVGDLGLVLLPLPLALAVTQFLHARWRRSIGGITGDTLGAGVEIGTTVALVAVALLG